MLHEFSWSFIIIFFYLCTSENIQSDELSLGLGEKKKDEIYCWSFQKCEWKYASTDPFFSVSKLAFIGSWELDLDNLNIGDEKRKDK